MSLLSTLSFPNGFVGLQLGYNHRIPPIFQLIEYAISHPCVAILPFTLTAEKTKPYGYPRNLVTLGDHLKAARLDRGLRQRDVADMLLANQFSYINWEKNHREPEVRFLPAICDFLGYCPYEFPVTWGQKLRLHRRYQGLSRNDLAALAGFDPGSISKWEMDHRKPTGKYLNGLKQVFGSGLCDDLNPCPQDTKHRDVA